MNYQLIFIVKNLSLKDTWYFIKTDRCCCKCNLSGTISAMS